MASNDHESIRETSTSIPTPEPELDPRVNSYIAPDDDTNSIPGQQRRFFGAAAEDGAYQRESLLSGQSTPSGNPFRNSLTASTNLLGHRDSNDEFGTSSLKPEDEGLDLGGLTAQEEKRDRILHSYSAPQKRKRFVFLGALVLAALLVIFLVVFLPVYFTVIKKHNNNVVAGGGDGGGSGGGGAGGEGGGGGGGDGGHTNKPITGTDGSIITTDTGANFTYRNTFGGSWVDDPNDPFNNGARAQNWVPALNQSWNWGVDRIFGVNLGGWLNTESFISPALYEQYPGTVDEWTLSQAMASDTANGGLAKIMENHYNTFITEEDFAQIAAAGLSWVRIPIAFWAISKLDEEPFLEGVSWKYFLKAVKWARKYGLRINLDLHTMPGSQNGYNHSGKLGSINFLNGTMGIANAQRGLDYIRILTEFISQPEYSDVIPMFGIMNEAVLKTISKDILSHFYLEAHNIVRNITGVGAGKGAWISIHDGFQGVGSWSGYMAGADRLILDSHPYFCFVDQDGRPLAEQVDKPCKSWGSGFNQSMSAFGMTIAGEWSLGFNDCGKWLNGVGAGTRWEGTFFGYKPSQAVGVCSDWTNWPAFSQSTKTSLNNFASSSMDALPNWFFWTWKIGNSSVTGKVEAPLWSYKLGLDNGWIPADPRTSAGRCAAAGVNSPFPGLQPAQNGGKGAGTIDPDFVASYSAWPPSSLASIPNVQYLPTYTATGTVPTLSPPAYTDLSGKTIDGGSGWYDSADVAKAAVEVQGCQYPDPWNAVQVPVPTAQCTGSSSRKKRAPMPKPTPPPTTS